MICEGKKTNWEEEYDKVGVVWSWSSKLATQHRLLVTAFIFVFCFSFFFFSFFSFLLSISTTAVSHLLSICFEFFLGFQIPFTWLVLGRKKTFDFWIKDGKMFQLLDFCSFELVMWLILIDWYITNKIL